MKLYIQINCAGGPSENDPQLIRCRHCYDNGSGEFAVPDHWVASLVQAMADGREDEITTLIEQEYPVPPCKNTDAHRWITNTIYNRTS